MFNCSIVLSSDIPCSQVLSALSICWSKGHQPMDCIFVACKLTHAFAINEEVFVAVRILGIRPENPDTQSVSSSFSGD